MRDETDPERRFRERLSERVAASGLSQKDLKRLSEGVSRQSVYRIVEGQMRPTLNVAVRLASALKTTVGDLLGESATPAPLIPPDAIDQAERLAREAAELAARLRSAGRPMGEIREAPVVWGPRPAFTLAQLDAEMDEPQEVRKSEVPVVAFVAAGADRNVAEAPTGETAMILNPHARLVQEGKRFVSRVVGDSMEPNLPAGDLVLFERVTWDTVRRGDPVYVVFDGQPMVKVIDFKRLPDGTPTKIRLRSTNAPDLLPNGESSFALIGRALERVGGVPDFRFLLDGPG